MKSLEIMLGLINPSAIPALRIAGALFLIINSLALVYLFRNRHRFFDRDRNVDNDIPAVRHLRVEVIFIPWLFLTLLLLVVWIGLWINY